jgi:hypothetical protein
MKRMIVLAALVGLSGSSLLAGGSNVRGSYVEARTAEVFTGGCMMNSEAGTAGKEAILAWKIDQGSYNGVSLNGLSVVAAVAGTSNLGTLEMGGDRPSIHSRLFVDQRANPAQRMALVAFANELSNGLTGTIVNVTPITINYAENDNQVQVSAGEVALDVNKHVVHDPSCGAQLWFKPLTTVSADNATLGMTDLNLFEGAGLGVKWSDHFKRSAFFGTFSR